MAALPASFRDEGAAAVLSAAGVAAAAAAACAAGTRPHDASSSSESRNSAYDKLIHQGNASWAADKEKILVGPFDYLDGHPGKDVRAQLIAAFNAWLQVPKQSLAIITKVVGMLHTASLLVDDVEDSSQLRRGIPVAHSIFGTAQTINSANYIYFLALTELQRLEKHSADAISIYTAELLNLHRGQGMDLYWRDTLTCPTEEDYLEMVSNKTGGLFRLAVKLMQSQSSLSREDPNADPTAANCPKDCVPLVNTIGLLFQILDDYQNLRSPGYAYNKGMAEDLTEGKFSFPVIHAIRADPTNLVLLNVLKQKTQDEDVKRYAIAYMERVGSFQYTRRIIEELKRKAVSLIERLDDGESVQVGAGVHAIIDRMRCEDPSPSSASALSSSLSSSSSTR